MAAATTATGVLTTGAGIAETAIKAGGTEAAAANLAKGGVVGAKGLANIAKGAFFISALSAGADYAAGNITLGHALTKKYHSRPRFNQRSNSCCWFILCSMRGRFIYS